MASINARLDQIIPKIKEQKFIDGRGLGNEISFYIFDYNPEDELLVRDYIKHIKKEFSIPGSIRSIIEFDLYKMLLELARDMGIFEEIFIMEQKDGKDAVLQALIEFTEPQIFLDKMQSEIGGHNLVFITGIGKAFPFVRSHNILNKLQDVIDNIPVILFFPGVYDGQSLCLFGKIKDDNYYRAFPLIDRK